MKQLILFTLLFSLSFTTSITAQNKQTHEERLLTIYDGMKKAVQSKDFIFIGDWVFNNKQRAKLNSGTNTLTIAKGNASGQLSALGAEEGKFITIEGKILNYKASYNDDKQEITLEFKVNGKQFYIDIKQSGRVFLTLKLNNSEITQVGSIK